MTNATQGRELTLDLRTREFLAQPLTPTWNVVHCCLCAWPSVCTWGGSPWPLLAFSLTEYAGDPVEYLHTRRVLLWWVGCALAELGILR